MLYDIYYIKRIKNKSKNKLNIKIKKKSMMRLSTSALEIFYCGCRHPQYNFPAKYF